MSTIKKVNYCLDCGTSKTLWHRSCPDCEMGYYLGYRTSETTTVSLPHRPSVNYYLDYHTSETRRPCAGTTKSVNYYLDYGTSETEQ